MIKAPTGTKISCKGWIQEAAMRMLMNNLDPEVAERPEDLIVYGGSGKAARNWDSYNAIISSLKNLENIPCENFNFVWLCSTNFLIKESSDEKIFSLST